MQKFLVQMPATLALEVEAEDTSSAGKKARSLIKKNALALGHMYAKVGVDQLDAVIWPELDNPLPVTLVVT